jgi:hypothetical protein
MPHRRSIPPAAVFPLGIAASLAAFATPGLTAEPPARAALTERPDVPALRARGPAGLDELLARYDRASAADRDALADDIDAVAAQRYATVSRLYWFTELDRAEAEAQRLHRPILALRMLGDLRNDLSCANSRLFRATLYANTEVSAFLRSHFVLYWSSERAVPTVTIDYGDGRKLVRTTTGNSAHYVLDEDGHVLDVLPGLYAPAVFQKELTVSLALADQVRGKTDAERVRATVAYHRAAIEATAHDFKRAKDALYISGGHFLLDREGLTSAIQRAQTATMSKIAIEAPDLVRIGAMAPSMVPGDEAAWAAIGQRVWGIRTPEPLDEPVRQHGEEQAAYTAELRARSEHRPHPQPDPGAPAVPPPASIVLDAASRALVARLHNAGLADRAATPAQLAEVIARLEHHIVADTALNQFTLRGSIRWRIDRGDDADFETLNAWIYDQVFATPRSDAWLGLLPRTDFTGLPGDGVVMPR